MLKVSIFFLNPRLQVSSFAILVMSPKVSILTYTSCAMLIAALVLCGPTSSAVAKNPGGKRFDCRLFCRLTGYHGMIGGCRCSFTLFTAKRTDPTW